MDKRRVVVTGIGTVNCLGGNTADFWEALISGADRIDVITGFDPSGYATTRAGQVKDEYTFNVAEKREEREVDRFSLLGLAAAKEAVEDSGLVFEEEDSRTVGVCMGSGMGGMVFYENQIAKFVSSGSNNRLVHPLAVQKITPNALSGRLAMRYNCQATNMVVSTACSSGNHAIGLAMRSIMWADAEIMLAGGAEAPLLPVNFASFDNMRVMSRTGVCRPFDSKRDGFVMGEGAAVLVLEELTRAKKRKAKIYAEVCGYGSSCGAYHMVKIKDGGEDEALAMKRALNDSKINVEYVDYISAHGTGTIQNDVNEAIAVRSVFKEHADKVTVSSIKGATGHIIGASAAVEAVASVMSIERDLIPPNLNFEIDGTGVGLSISKKPVEREVRAVVSNAFGFGNNNAVLVFKKFWG